MLRIIACAASLAGALFLAAPAAAAPGGKTTGSSSISLVMAGARTADATVAGPHYGDVITFDVKTDETAYPFVRLLCHQGRTLVVEGYQGFFDSALGGRMFGLSSPSWTGGAADCTGSVVTLVNGRWKELASTSFHVEA